MEKEFIDRRYHDIANKEGYESFALGLPIGIIYNQIYTRYAARVKSRFNLSVSEADILVMLYHENGILSPTDLSKALFFTSGGITRLLKSMEKDGYISRTPSPHDARSSLVQLEKKGVVLVEELMSINIETSKEFTKNIPSKEKQQLFSILKKIVYENI